MSQPTLAYLKARLFRWFWDPTQVDEKDREFCVRIMKDVVEMIPDFLRQETFSRGLNKASELLKQLGYRKEDAWLWVRLMDLLFEIWPKRVALLNELEDEGTGQSTDQIGQAIEEIEASDQHPALKRRAVMKLLAK